MELLPGQQWKHIKRGTTYRVICRATLDPSGSDKWFDGLMVRVWAELSGAKLHVLARLQCSDVAYVGRMTPLVLYIADKDGLQWVRPVSEFMDGRFMRVT